MSADDLTKTPESCHPHRPRRLDPAVYPDVARAYAEGRKLEDVAAEFGVSAATVRNILIRVGVERRTTASYLRTPADVEAEVCRLYAETLTTIEIGERLGMSCVAAFHILHRNGVATRDRSESRHKLNPEARERFFRRYAEIGSMRAVAEEFGIDERTAKGLLRKQGIRTRTLSEIGRRYTLDETVFDTITESSAYWIGFLMADGCVYINKWKIFLKLALCEIDAEHVREFGRFLKTDRPVETVHSEVNGYENSRPCASLTIYSKRIVESLARYGLTPRKSFTAKVIGLEMNRDFWRGVIDGDGSVGTAKGAPRLSLVGSYPMMEQFREFIYHHAPGAALQIADTWSGIHQVRVSHTRAMKLIEVLYGDCTVALVRKWERAKVWLVTPYVNKNLLRTQRSR